MAIPPSFVRLATASCALALAFGFVACGEDDEESTAGKATTADTERPKTSPATLKEPASDEAQIKALASLIQTSFDDGNGAALCDGFTAGGQRDMVDYGHATGLSGSCADVVRGIAKRNRAQGVEQEPARVVAVRVRGSHAVALVRTASVAPVRQRYVRENGKWKIRSLGLGAAVGVASGQE